jgi:hypothetical protein
LLVHVPGSLLAADDVDDDEDRSWLGNILHRYFGHTVIIEDKIDGAGLENVGPYVAYEGKTIELVIVRQVQSFESGWDDDRMGAERLLNSLSDRFRDYTRESIIRQYLLFRQGDTLVPYDLTDTEIMLRQLPYINDVRIHVVPIDGEPDKVGIVIETNDRWPVGVTATVVTKDRWRAKLFSTNVAGLGLAFSNEVLFNRESQQQWGYRGELSKENIGGSFWEAKTRFEDSYQKNNLLLELNRPLAHPGIKFIGGASWQYLEEFESDEYKRGMHQSDLWVGKVIKLYDRVEVGGGDRPMLVPALRILDRDHYHRPAVHPDSNRSYHDFTQYMASLTWQRVSPYKTNYLFGEGEIEDVPTGWSLKTTAAYEDGEFQHRPGLFFDSYAVSMRNRGDVAFAGLSLGGFFDSSQRFEDGILDLKAGYFTVLMGDDSFRHRFYGAVKYTLGISRHFQDRIYLSDKSGIYGLNDGIVGGNHRLIGKGMYRIFTPWSVIGFRMSFFAFGDVGMVGEEDSSLFKEKIYVSTGLGVRFRNPGLVFPTIQLNVSMLSNVDNTDLAFGLKIGNVPSPQIIYPGTRPGALAYR